MSINGIGTQTSSYYGLYSRNTDQTDTDDTSANSASSTSTRQYPDTWKGQIQKQVDELLADIPKSGNKLTMSDVIAYRDQVTQQLQDDVQSDLEALGVDTTEDINLGLDDNGNVVAAAGTPNKDLIDRYFQANPDKVEEYTDALKLSKLTSMAETKMTPSQIRSQLSTQAISAWTSQNADSDIFSGSLNLTLSQAGLPTTSFGLNLTVKQSAQARTIAALLQPRRILAYGEYASALTGGGLHSHVLERTAGKCFSTVRQPHIQPIPQ